MHFLANEKWNFVGHFWSPIIAPHIKHTQFLMAKNWQNLGFVAHVLTKFALFDEQKMAFSQQNLFEFTNDDTVDVKMIVNEICRAVIDFAC